MVQPDISIVVPAYNEAQRIARTLTSIQAHLPARGLDYEIIVAADGSDGTREAAAALAARDPRISVFGEARRGGTLPKDWAEAQKIKKNDPLGLVAQPDGTILVTRDITEGQFQREKRFDVSDIHEPTFLFRMLIGSYIAGYTTITITSKTRLPPPVRMVVRDFTQMTIGPEVVEETDTKIILKDLLNPAEMPFENTIKRMYVIVKNMHLDAMIALGTRNKSLCEDVIARDNDVDRLHWLIARQTNTILKNASLGRKMGVLTSKGVNTYIISRIIERIGDHAVRISESAQKKFSANPGEVDEIIEVPLTALQDKKNFAEEILEVGGRPIMQYFYHYRDHVIYGATARIVKHFLEVVGPAASVGKTG